MEKNTCGGGRVVRLREIRGEGAAMANRHLVVIFSMLSWSACAAEAHAPAAVLEASADDVQPAGAPILLSLVARNTGGVPISYWCGGPGEYPDAADFAATIWSDAPHAKPMRVPLSNGQHSNDAGAAREVPQGRSVRFPAALPPLPPGVYHVTIDGAAQGRREWKVLRAITWPETRTEQVLRVEVRDDPKLLDARNRWLLDAIRADDPFAQHLSATWPAGEGVRRALVKDLMGDNVVAADRAADGLWGEGSPAESDPAVVAGALVKHLKPREGGCDMGLMDKLLRMKYRPDSTELAAAMVRLATSRNEGTIRRAAIACFDLPQQGPVDRSSTGRFHVRGGESDPVARQQHDAAAVAALLQLAGSADPQERKLAIRLLSDYPDSAAAVARIKSAAGDGDRDVRIAAIGALNVVTAPPTTRP